MFFINQVGYVRRYVHITISLDKQESRVDANWETLKLALYLGNKTLLLKYVKVKYYIFPYAQRNSLGTDRKLWF